MTNHVNANATTSATTATADASCATNTRRAPALRRWVLAAVGVWCVGLAALGVVLPGLPTTIFLIAACWCFTRSCPYLEDRLVRNKFFQPFLRYLEPDAPMPLRARLAAIAIMWTAILISMLILTGGDLTAASASAAPVGLIIGIPAAGLVGTVMILCIRRAQTMDHQGVEEPCPATAPRHIAHGDAISGDSDDNPDDITGTSPRCPVHFTLPDRSHH